MLKHVHGINDCEDTIYVFPLYAAEMVKVSAGLYIFVYVEKLNKKMNDLLSVNIATWLHLLVLKL